MLTHDFGNGNFLRVTGQVVAWVREDYNFYQINADDVYAQIGKKGVWDVMAGRFLTWRVFRKGLGFDLYTLEDTGARTKPNFADQSGWYSHMYEVNTIFMRDSFGSTPVPAGRVALHYYPSSWSGIELVGSYGRLQSGGNVAGGRIAAGIQQKYFNALGGAEYEHWAPPQQIGGPDPATGSFIACDKCGVANAYGAGGSAALTLNPVEFVLDAAYRKFDSWNGQVTSVLTSSKTTSFGGYLQLDAGGLFRTEFLDNDKLFQRHWQAAGYIAYPLGFNNAVVKLVLSKATGYQTHRDDPVLDSDMYSLRLRFAFYY